MLLVFSLLVDDYLSGRFFNRLTTSVAIIAVRGRRRRRIVIITRNIDLSVGSIVGVTAYVTGELRARHPTAARWAFAHRAWGSGCVLGAVNGALVAYGRVPAIIVTLGHAGDLSGRWLVSRGEGRTITADSLPDWVADLPQRTVSASGDLDLRLVFVVVVAGRRRASSWRCSCLRWGRRLYAIGSNPDAARQAGLPSQRLVFSAFCACGALSRARRLPVPGPLRHHHGRRRARAWSCDSVAAAVVGGVSILGGSGTLVGALLGAMLIDVLDQSLVRVPAGQRVLARRPARGADPARGRRRRGHRPAVPHAGGRPAPAPADPGSRPPRRRSRPMPSWSPERSWEACCCADPDGDRSSSTPRSRPSTSASATSSTSSSSRSRRSSSPWP